MDRMMNRYADKASDQPSPLGIYSDRHADGSFMALDMYETSEQFVFKFALPGVAPEDIEVMLVGNTLTVQARVEPRTEENARHLYRERRYGSFCRTVELPNVDTSEASASLEQGLLTLTFGKPEEKQAKTIQIKPK